MVLLGKPATGKATQGRILGAAPGVVYVSMREMLRALSETSTETADRVRRPVERGELLPDGVVLSLFARHLDSLQDRHLYDPHSDFLVLDGIPRTVSQARGLDRSVEAILVVHLRCGDDDVLAARVEGEAAAKARGVDRGGSLRERLATYALHTAPVLELYPSDRLVEVDALEPPLLVHFRILRRLLPLVVEVPERGAAGAR